MSLLPSSITKLRSKTTDKRWRHRFPHYKSMGAFRCHGNQSFDPICPKTVCSLSPTPVMLHIKFDQDWPTGFRHIQVWKCGRWRRQQMMTHDDGRTTDHWYTISSPCELKMLVLIYTSQSIHRLTCCGKPEKVQLPLPVVNLDKASVCGDRKTSFSFWQKIGIYIYREFRSVGRDSYLGAQYR